jgi:hypothetical protein
MALDENLGVVVVSNHDQTPAQAICGKVLDFMFSIYPES